MVPPKVILMITKLLRVTPFKPIFHPFYLSDRRPKTFHQIAVLRLMRHSQENREGQINWRQEIQRSTEVSCWKT